MLAVAGAIGLVTVQGVPANGMTFYGSVALYRTNYYCA